ncbi:MAG: TolC family protein [Chitinivibrionales bacterium]
MQKYRIILRRVLGIIIAAHIMIIAGCAHDSPRLFGSPGVSPRPEIPWIPPQKAIDKQTDFQASALQLEKPMGVPQDILANIQNLSLAEIVYIALLNNKQTRQAWAQARASAAAYGSKQGSYFPQISASASADRLKNPTLGAQFSSGAWEYSPGASLTWLLFDFGGRGASVEEAREALFASDWTHNATIQDVILRVEQAFYGYFAAKAFLTAQKATVDETQTSLSATNDRRAAGLATIADVLQAQTALSQATLAFETLQGQLMTTRGTLATAMGLPANTGFDVDLPVGAPPVSDSKKTVQEYLDIAVRQRPDLAAARAQALSSDAHIKYTQAQGYPSLSTNGSIGELYFNTLSTGTAIYSAGIGIGIPLFTGFSHHYDVLQAKAQADAARANAQNTRDLVTLQVWTSYYNLETAGQMLSTSDDLLKSASQNYDVALGRYKAGVGGILDLLTAQAALQNARAQQVQARAGWWLALAQLAHDTGTLEMASIAGREQRPMIDRK